MIPVWTYPPRRLTKIPEMDVKAVEFGDGYVKTGSSSVAWDHQDGTGGADVSHRFRWRFVVELPPKTAAQAFTIWDFLKGRFEANFESFYFYDSEVSPNASDWDGINTAGRHLVKCLEPPKWPKQVDRLAHFEPLEFVEVRS